MLPKWETFVSNPLLFWPIVCNLIKLTHRVDTKIAIDGSLVGSKCVIDPGRHVIAQMKKKNITDAL